jgi:hypothetical protein
MRPDFSRIAWDAPLPLSPSSLSAATPTPEGIDLPAVATEAHLTGVEHLHYAAG